MKKPIIIFAILISTILITSCSPVIIASTPRTVIIGNIFDDNEALMMAEEACQQYNKHAVLMPKTEIGRRENYECKD